MTGALLASAAAEPGNATIELVLATAFTSAAAAALVAVPAVIAGRRRHRQRELVVGLGVVWALVATSVVVWAVNRQWTAADERERDVLSGDVDPRTLPPEVGADWPLWGGSGLVYAGLVVWAVAGPGGGSPPLRNGPGGG